MRIAFTSTLCWPEVRRGAERLVGELSAAVAGLGHEVTVFGSAFGGTGRSTEGGVHWVRFRRRRESVWAAEADFGRRVLPALARGRFDVVHSYGRRDAVASINAARLHPRRVTAFTDIGLPQRSYWAQHGREAGFVERVVRDVDVYGCMSRHALDLLATDYGRVGALTPGGVDLVSFAPTGSRSATPTILFTSAVDAPEKGLATLLAALPAVADEVPDVRLVVCGPGDAGPLLAAAPPGAAERTDVEGVGRIEDLAARYASAWCCALPSMGDTFGLVVVEALASGTPVAASNHAALPELVEPGVTGELCTPGDPASVAQACIGALALAAQPGTADACRDSAAPFDWRTSVAPRVVSLYEEHLGRS